MKIRVKQALTLMLTAIMVFTMGSCKPVPEHTMDAPLFQGGNGEEFVSSEILISDTDDDWWADMQISSASSSEGSKADDGSADLPNKGNQIIIDDSPDVMKPNDPEDPMGPNHEAGDDKPLDDTIVLPPPASSSTASSKPNSSTAPPSSKPDSSSTTSTPSKPDTSSTVTSVPSKPDESSETQKPSAPESSEEQESSSTPSSKPESSSQASSQKPPFDPPKDGWYEYEGKKYLYQGGKPVTGYQRLNGLTYYFDANGVLSSRVGIDVSSWQGNIDWNKVKAAGVEFAIIRIGIRGYGSSGNMKKDDKFLQNLVNATSVGIDCGLYFFTQAITKAEAEEEAEQVVKWINEAKAEKDKNGNALWPVSARKYLNYPIYFDTELSSSPSGTGRADKLSKSKRTETVIGFCERMKKLGYYPGIYASTDWLKNWIDMSKLKAYDVWVAHYGVSKPGYTGEYKMWQYTGKGSMSGISGAVDLNVGLFDYATFIKQNGWNHLDK